MYQKHTKYYIIMMFKDFLHERLQFNNFSVYANSIWGSRNTFFFLLQNFMSKYRQKCLEKSIISHTMPETRLLLSLHCRHWVQFFRLYHFHHHHSLSYKLFYNTSHFLICVLQIIIECIRVIYRTAVFLNSSQTILVK